MPAIEENPLDNIVIILVQPLNAGNIGSAARAMKNMGLTKLRLVHPPLDRKEEAKKLAHGAEEILEEAMRVFTLEEALDGIHYVIGTTARLGGWRAQSATPKRAASEILSVARTNKTAILFGSEDRGLSNDHIKHCQMLLHIPCHKSHTSLNLAQAVLLVAYELFQGELGQMPLKPRYAKAEHWDAMFEDLRDALQRINFLRPGNPDYWMMAFKRLFGRTGLTEREINMVRGVCRQIRWIHSKTDLAKREEA